MRAPIGLIVPLFCAGVFAQHAKDPDEPLAPGIAADERIDVTGDGIADLLITSREVRVSDPQQPGYLGQYKREVKTLPGASMLQWSTPNRQHFYTPGDKANLDTAEIAARLHFKQLYWVGVDTPLEFRLLHRPFGPGITAEMDGWYGDEHYPDTLVLRSTAGGRTSISAFAFELPYPYGRIVIKAKEVLAVPNGFGQEGDPQPAKPKVTDPMFDFGHEESGPQVQVPPGVAPDEMIDLIGDDLPEIAITTANMPHHATEPMGTYARGLRMLPGTALLMARDEEGQYKPFQLLLEQELNPTHLEMGLQTGSFRWADPRYWQVWVEAVTQRYGPIREADELEGWLPTATPLEGVLVFRALEYGRPMIGGLELGYSSPGGEVSVRLVGLVNAGEVLQAR